VIYTQNDIVRGFVGMEMRNMLSNNWVDVVWRFSLTH